jgi:hypothetical protein
MMRFVLTLLGVAAYAASLSAQQPAFRWIDFHAQQDAPTVTWVERSLAAEKWTAIREIGVLYDAALVVTTERPGPQAPPASDTFTVWSVSLANRNVYRLIHGANLRIAGLVSFGGAAGPEPAALYDNCADCAADTYFTAFHYDLKQRMWLARWLRGEQAAPVWSAAAPGNVQLTQIYALMTDNGGRSALVTWKRFDGGKDQKPEEFLYQYDLEPEQNIERTMLLFGRAAEQMKSKLCSAQGALPELARGQDAPLCREFAKPLPARKPTTTPPAHNQGQSTPPGSKAKR